MPVGKWETSAVLSGRANPEHLITNLYELLRLVQVNKQFALEQQGISAANAIAGRNEEDYRDYWNGVYQSHNQFETQITALLYTLNPFAGVPEG